MATTIPTAFVGTPTLTEEKVAIIKEWYISNLGDSDKADSDDHDFYMGCALMAEDVLRVLFDMPAGP